ncbi:hypothetical protein COCOBI_16-0320 [Coccomyxa sp. Obi]|nr:hypothetical protein COCOBI_16-0320 [Coccomyxa sp. Obi]
MGAAQCAAGVRTDFNGKWRKDKSASQMDCYSKQLDLLQLQGVQKSLAQKLINGLQIQQNDESMRVQFTVDKVPFYKHTEEFRLGQEVSMSRRDKKSGMQHAVLRAVPEGVQVDIKLDAPFSGNILETYTCPKDGVLQVESITQVNGKSEKCIQVYRRI